jgi:hypothetical protein
MLFLLGKDGMTVVGAAGARRSAVISTEFFDAPGRSDWWDQPEVFGRARRRGFSAALAIRNGVGVEYLS